ncbi:hypothetical protein R70241_05087 [Paraburkholderia saeva]|nr:hypothetical protein R70241_05087 [Paraburkholderia saeva]
MRIFVLMEIEYTNLAWAPKRGIAPLNQGATGANIFVFSTSAPKHVEDSSRAQGSPEA